MSSTLLETVAIHTLYVDLEPRQNDGPSPDETLATQLAHLASQHQKSEYNRFKFGPRGAPMTYSPMSMHSPGLVKDLKVRQATYSTTKSWWLSEKRSLKYFSEPSFGPQVVACDNTADLKQELIAAIESPLSKNRPPNVQMKTSETHPINVSTIVPFEMLPIISSYLVKAQSWSPVLYDLPPSYYLDRVTTYEDPIESSPSLLKVIPPPVPQLCWNRGTVSQALQMAMTTGIRKPLKPRSLPVSRTESAPPLMCTDPSTFAIAIEKVAPRPPPTPPKSHRTHNMIGNLFLSSCPGKKVRLMGPVNGRVGVCRDLGRDLSRIKELGVGCVVCCLDDTELEYLGVSWSDYSRLANEKGLDVLRIPIPEGLAPPSPEALNTSLNRLIETYTLHNIPILVHCRGGVGRAGLVACCWILKLGLCGWIETQPSPAPSISADGVVRRDTLQLVERVISVVRRRRSVKAIETFEQVLFLVQFVEYLREHGLAPGSPKSLNDLELRIDDDSEL